LFLAWPYRQLFLSLKISLFNLFIIKCSKKARLFVVNIWIFPQKSGQRPKKFLHFFQEYPKIKYFYHYFFFKSEYASLNIIFFDYFFEWFKYEILQRGRAHKRTLKTPRCLFLIYWTLCIEKHLPIQFFRVKVDYLCLTFTFHL